MGLVFIFSIVILVFGLILLYEVNAHEILREEQKKIYDLKLGKLEDEIKAHKNLHKDLEDEIKANKHLLKDCVKEISTLNRIAIIGIRDVGKTTLFNTFFVNSIRKPSATRDIETYVQIVGRKEVDKKDIKTMEVKWLKIFDVPGEKYKEATLLFTKEPPEGIIFVVDLFGDIASLQSVEARYKEDVEEVSDTTSMKRIKYQRSLFSDSVLNVLLQPINNLKALVFLINKLDCAEREGYDSIWAEKQYEPLKKRLQKYAPEKSSIKFKQVILSAKNGKNSPELLDFLKQQFFEDFTLGKKL